jgi:hypothetical protein
MATYQDKSTNPSAQSGGVMLGEGKPNPSKIADALDVIKAFVDAAFMASNELTDYQRDAMRGLLDETSNKIGEVQKEFTEVYCGGYVDLARGEVSPVVDPTFAAIERHKVAFEALGEVALGVTATAAERDANRQACDALGAALDEFEATIPTTIAGLRAAIEYAVEIDRDCIPHVGGRIAAALLKSPVFASAAARR